MSKKMEDIINEMKELCKLHDFKIISATQYNSGYRYPYAMPDKYKSDIVITDHLDILTPSKSIPSENGGEASQRSLVSGLPGSGIRKDAEYEEATSPEH